MDVAEHDDAEHTETVTSALQDTVTRPTHVHDTRHNSVVKHDIDVFFSSVDAGSTLNCDVGRLLHRPDGDIHGGRCCGPAEPVEVHDRLDVDGELPLPRATESGDGARDGAC